MGFPFERLRADDPYRARRPRSGANPAASAQKGSRMEKLPDSLAIGFWITGSCWAVALVACLFGASTEWLLPLFMFGLLAGVTEWVLRRDTR